MVEGVGGEVGVETEGAGGITVIDPPVMVEPKFNESPFKILLQTSKSSADPSQCQVVGVPAWSIGPAFCGAIISGAITKKGGAFPSNWPLSK